MIEIRASYAHEFEIAAKQINILGYVDLYESQLSETK